MTNEEIFNINIQIIINRNLYKKNIIDENTFIRIEEILLKKIKELQLL